MGVRRARHQGAAGREGGRRNNIGGNQRMTIQALGYVGVGAAAPDDWSDFATGMVGMQVVDRGAGRCARSAWTTASSG